MLDGDVWRVEETSEPLAAGDEMTKHVAPLEPLAMDEGMT